MPLSPNVSSWEENRTLHLLGHLDFRKQGKTLPSWREEVLAARKFQEQFAEDLEIDANEDVQPAKLSHPILESASQAADILHQNGLDGRDINAMELRLNHQIFEIPSRANENKYFCRIVAFIHNFFVAPNYTGKITWRFNR